MRENSLSSSLRRLIATNPDGYRLSVVLGDVGEKGYGLLLCLLAIPSALPVPAPGYSTPFGIMLAAIAWQMVRGCSRPRLPARAERLHLSKKNGDRIFTAGLKFLAHIEKFIRPRMSWIGSIPGKRLMGLVIIIMACLMVLPIPLTNTAPAMVIFLIGVGLSEEDGVLAGLATLLGALATLLYVAIIYLFIQLVLSSSWSEATDTLKETIKAFFI